MLLIHGQIDSNIPVRHSRRIKQLNPAIELWEVPGADHCGAISTAPQELESRLVSWYAQRRGPAHDVRSSRLHRKVEAPMYGRSELAQLESTRITVSAQHGL